MVMQKHIQSSWPYWFAALQPERAVLPQFVVQVVEVEAEGGRSLIEGHVKVRPELRHIQGLWLPVCRDRKKTKSPSHCKQGHALMIW